MKKNDIHNRNAAITAELPQNIAATLEQKRPLILTALAAELAALHEDKNDAEKLDTLVHEIVDICYQALLHDKGDVERVGEILATECSISHRILSTVQNTIATLWVDGLSPTAISRLYPRVIKLLTDMSTGFCQACHPDAKLQHELQELKEAHAALAEKESRYRMLAESAQDYIFIINREDKVDYLNKHARELIQSSEVDFTDSARSQLFAKDSNELQRRNLQDVFETARPSHRQEWTILRDGKRVFLDTRLVPLVENDHVEAVLGISRDLTRQKMIEEQIAEQEKKYRTLFDTIHNAIFLLEHEKIIECNESAVQLFERTKQELVGASFYSLFQTWGHTDDDSIKELQSTLAGFSNDSDVQDLELDYVRPEREKLHFEIHFLRFQASERWQVLVVIRNITQYKRATEAIRASEARFRDIIERSLDGYFFIDVTYRLTYLNPSAESILTYSREELNKHVLSTIKNKHNTKLYRSIKQTMGGKTFESQEFSFTDRHNESRWVTINFRRVYDDGEVIGIEGFIKDITHRKKAEIELLENEARYRALFENTPYDVFGLTPDRVFLKVNQNFQQNWGRMEGKSLDSLKPQKLAREIADLCQTVKETKRTHETTYSRTARGKKNYYNIIIAPIITDDKTMIGYAGLVIDVTDSVNVLREKKTFAEKLIQTSEEEQRRISRDIHDSLGQILFALQLDISAAKSLINSDKQQAGEVLENSQSKLTTCMKEANNICHRLSPRLLEDFGLVEALDDLVQNINTSGALSITFDKKWSERPKNKCIETALFRVSQEALANVLKHAQASKVHMRLAEDAEIITLEIADNGKGFELSAVENQQKRGFGLMNMKERIEIMGGHFEILAVPQRGVNIKMSIPARGTYEED